VSASRATTVADLMSAPAVAVDELTPVKAVASLLTSRGFNGVPVTTRLGRVVGVITEDDLVMRQDPRVMAAGHLWSDPHRAERRRAQGKVAREVMSPHPVTIAPGMPTAAAAERMHEHHLKTLPVVDDEGTLVGVLTRRDLLKLLTRPDREVAADVRERMRRESVDRRGLEISVADGVVTIKGWVEAADDARRLRKVAEAVDGVVAVRVWVNAEELLERPS